VRGSNADVDHRLQTFTRQTYIIIIIQKSEQENLPSPTYDMKAIIKLALRKSRKLEKRRGKKVAVLVKQDTLSRFRCDAPVG
jgi:hypothetical protein